MHPSIELGPDMAMINLVGLMGRSFLFAHLCLHNIQELTLASRVHLALKMCVALGERHGEPLARPRLNEQAHLLRAALEFEWDRVGVNRVVPELTGCTKYQEASAQGGSAAAAGHLGRAKSTACVSATGISPPAGSWRLRLRCVQREGRGL